jgi:hypothetical protein
VNVAARRRIVVPPSYFPRDQTRSPVTSGIGCSSWATKSTGKSTSLRVKRYATDSTGLIWVIGVKSRPAVEILGDDFGCFAISPLEDPVQRQTIAERRRHLFRRSSPAGASTLLSLKFGSCGVMKSGPKTQPETSLSPTEKLPLQPFVGANPSSRVSQRAKAWPSMILQTVVRIPRGCSDTRSLRQGADVEQ